MVVVGVSSGTVSVTVSSGVVLSSVVLVRSSVVLGRGSDVVSVVSTVSSTVVLPDAAVSSSGLLGDRHRGEHAHGGDGDGCCHSCLDRHCCS